MPYDTSVMKTDVITVRGIPKEYPNGVKAALVTTTTWLTRSEAGPKPRSAPWGWRIVREYVLSFNQTSVVGCGVMRIAIEFLYSKEDWEADKRSVTVADRQDGLIHLNQLCAPALGLSVLQDALNNCQAGVGVGKDGFNPSNELDP